MPSQAANYYRPQTPEMAVELLANLQGAAVIGGATLALGKLGGGRPSHLIDLCDAGLDRIGWRGHHLSIGATTTMRDLRRHPELSAPGLAAIMAMAGHFEPLPVAAQATLGGNLCTGVGSLVAPLLLYKAHAVLLGPDGERHAPIAPLRLHPGEIILSVELEPGSPMARSGCQSLRRTPVGPALVTLAALVDGDQLRLAVSGIEAPARRLRDLEGRWDRRSVAQWAESIAHVVRPIDDARGSADYRRAMVGVLAERLLKELLPTELREVH